MLVMVVLLVWEVVEVSEPWGVVSCEFESGRVLEGEVHTRRTFAVAVISGVKAQGARTAGDLEPPFVQTLTCSCLEPGLPCQWRRVSSVMVNSEYGGWLLYSPVDYSG